MTDLHLTDISMRFGSLQVLQNIQLQIRPGELTGLVGANGIGKSTLLKICAGLLKPTRGTVLWNGEPPAATQRYARAAAIGYVPQTIAAFSHLDIMQYVALGMHARTSWSRQLAPEKQQVLDHLLQDFELDALAHRNIATLSGGQLQRAAIAQVFAQNPRLMLLDEPFASLDIRYQQHLAKQLSQWILLDGAAALLSIHDINLARRVCHRILLLLPDGTMLDGNPVDILTPANLERAYCTRFYERGDAESGASWIEPA